jgi:DNA-binding transcriptional LysR family regulator
MAQAEAFLALAEELHFGRAAQRLHVSRPRVSRLVAALERQVGGALFERTTRRVTLTALGEQFHARLQPGYAQMQAALDHARRAAREAAGQLRIGFTVTTEGPALSRLIAAFEARHPGCEVTLHEASAADPSAALRGGEVDVLVNWLAVDEPDLTAGPAIDRQDRVLAVAASHPLAGRTQVTVEDLAGRPVPSFPPGFPAALRDTFVPPATPSGKPIPRTHRSRSTTETWMLVARGLVVHPTVSSMTQKLARDDIVLIPIADMPPVRLGLIWRTAHDNARIRALAGTARSIHASSPPEAGRHAGAAAAGARRPRAG